MTSFSELLSIYENAEELAEAENALDRIAAIGPDDEFPLGDYYDGLAEMASEKGDFALAVRAQRKAIELGCEFPELAEDMLAWYLLKTGAREEGEAAFARLRAERAGDPGIVSTLANARMDSGDGQGALEAYDEALDLAKSMGDHEWIDRLRGERQYCRYENGIPPDEDDRLAGRRQSLFPEATDYSVAWFPRDQIEPALARWPSLADDLDDPDAYCRMIEARLRHVRNETGRQPSVAPLQVDRLVGFAEENDLDADSGKARSQLAAEIGAKDEALPWPPGRNELCWCGSGRKYKRCCGRAR
ncbi:MAG TPA: SEC-C metal-binding domain-containing protein [Solirubrobacterales bacterium]|nr:SEC-C metal-binding domain-containing protein [Solirubrobacterales bacterium]